MTRTLRLAFCVSCAIGVSLGAPLLGQQALQQPPQPSEPAVFHSGTRLVEVEVVVRGQRIRPPGVGEWFKWVLDSGPPFGPPGDPLPGLTKDDFTLLDNGQPQPIALFRAGPASTGSKLSGNNPASLPPGAFSNRMDSSGRPLNGATAVLIDFLNTDFGCLGYERLGMTTLLRSLAQTDGRIALYTLGENLHVLHDFTSDPRELLDVAAKLDEPHGKLPPDYAAAVKDFGDLMDLGRDEVHGRMTAKAVRLILQHLAGVPGRKNLVWLMHYPSRVPPVVMALAQQANVVLYPVLVRAAGGELCPGVAPGEAEALAAVTGGRAFFDSLDLGFAIHATAEDAATAYVLGYYPPLELLDGKYHSITVKLFNKSPDKQTLEVHYRPGYLATKAAAPAPVPSPEELYEGRLNAAGVGLLAQVAPNDASPGRYDARVTVDLHDIHLNLNDGHFTGALDVSVPDPSSKGAIRTGTIPLDFADNQLPQALDRGFIVTLKGIEPNAGEIRIVVRDHSTGAAGSLRIPIEPSPSK